MRTDDVEIYSDASNYAVLRHPGRRFPGCLIQGDSLSILCQVADSVRRLLDEGDIDEACDELDELRSMLWDRLKHYEDVLRQHDIELPFRASTPNPPLEGGEGEDAT